MIVVRRLVGGFALALVVGALAGCGGGGDSPTEPGPGVTQNIADDVAMQAAAGVVAGKGGWMAEVEAASGMSGASASAISPAPLRWQADVPMPSLSETTFTRGGITIKMTRRFFDESGAELPSYGPTADRMMSTCRAYGTHEENGYSGTLGRTSWLDVHNLLASKETLEFDGGSNDTITSQFTSMDQSTTRHLYWVSNGTLVDVMVSKDRETNPYPLSGTATWAVSVDVLIDGDRGNVERHLDATAVVTFDGTGNPEMVVNGTYRYRIHLDSGSVVRV